MRAILSRRAGGSETLSLEEIDDPDCGPDEVRVCVHACGINYPDALVIRDLYQVKPERPFAPGTEIAGVVDQVGDHVHGFAIGDRVIGRANWGGLAEAVVLTPDRLISMPDAMPMEVGASFLFTFATAYYAIANRGQAHSGETMLVLGAAGGIGSAACAIGNALGLRVIAGVSSQEKLAFATQHGAHDGVIYSPELQPDGQRDLSKAFRAAAGANGIDIVCDAVGGNYAEAALRSLNPGGRHLVVGFTAGIPKIALNLALLKSCSIVGVNLRSLAMAEPEHNQQIVATLLDLYNQGKLKPAVSHMFPLEQARDAIAMIEERKANGKVVVMLR